MLRFFLDGFHSCRYLSKKSAIILVSSARWRWRNILSHESGAMRSVSDYANDKRFAARRNDKARL